MFSVKLFDAFIFIYKKKYMKFIIKLFPEIMIKSDSVRKRFIKILSSNIRNVLTKADESATVCRRWDFIEVHSKNEDKRLELIEILQKTPGIHHILEVKETTFSDQDDIFKKVLEKYRLDIENKSFCVRVKRKGKHSFTSIELERYVGGGLNQSVETARVKLKDPDVTVRFEIDDDKLILIENRFEGLGGYPLGTQESVLSLISGGFDSGVSSYMHIKRGSRVHYCFFNLGGRLHEIGVKQMAYHLWKNYGSSHKVKFITINFENVVGEILEKVENGQMGVVLKRMMVRAASKVCERLNLEAMVTGEALGQVSSQTLTNLRLIDKVSDHLVLRPLVAFDKEDIIKTAQKIGTADIAKTMPEFCGVISKNPTVKAVESTILQEENNFNFDVLEQAVLNAKVENIVDLENSGNEEYSLEEVSYPQVNDIIIDVRATEQADQNPLEFADNQVLNIPFFKIGNSFANLDQSKTYLFYCDRGVMSKIQALYLADQGYHNIKILKN